MFYALKGQHILAQGQRSATLGTRKPGNRGIMIITMDS